MNRKYKIIYFGILLISLSLLIFSSSNSLTYFHKKEITTNSHKYILKEDNIKPEITLVENEIVLKQGEEYKEPGFSAFDNIDGDITSKVTITSSLNSNEVGIYEINYSVTDSSGNNTEITRPIKVIENTIKYSNSSNNSREIIDKINELNNYLSMYKVSVGYINLNTNFTYLYQENKVYFGASLIKTLDAMYIYENNMLDNSIKEKIRLAISKSNNSAHSYLIDYIGFNNIKSYALNLGGNKLNCNNYYCDTTVTDQLTYLKHLYKIIKTNENGEELKSFFINDYGNYLSFDYTYSNLHKYGNSNDYFHDVGIFDTDNPYIIVVLTQEKNKDEKYVSDLIRHISNEINSLNNMI